MKIYSKKHLVRGIILIVIGIIAVVSIILKSLNHSTDRNIELGVLSFLCFVLGIFLLFQALNSNSYENIPDSSNQETFEDKKDV